MEYSKENDVYSTSLFTIIEEIFLQKSLLEIFVEVRRRMFNEMFMNNDFVEYEGNIWINILAHIKCC